jgi:hypothetical protein
MDRYEPVGEIVQATWLNHYTQQESFVGHPGEVSRAVAGILGPSPPAGQT